MKRALAICAAAGGAVALAFFAARHWPAKESLLEPAHPEQSRAATPMAGCLPTGDGFLRARLDGALDLKLDWKNDGTQCEGMPRPDNNGVRVTFSREIDAGQRRLVIVFGIAGLSESSSGHGLPANVTIIEEGLARIYSTQGDDKCTLDDVKQQLITPWRKESRTYRVSGRGFCIQPARAVGGDATVLMSTFDFVGQVIYTGTDTSPQATTHTT
jgi:hypothetical protein